MSESVASVRYAEGQSLIYATITSRVAAPLLIWDVCGEVEPPLLRERLAQFRIAFRPRIVVLRGLSAFLRAEIVEGTGRRALTDAFGDEAALVELCFTPSPSLHPMSTAAEAILGMDPDDLIAACADIELHALAVWAEAVWTQQGAHFVLPSGEHADKFLRAGDVCSDPVSLSRVADWVLAGVGTGAVLVTDNYSLLPLLQEVQIRRLRSGHEELPRYVLPSYGSSQESFVAKLTAIAAEAGRKDLPILAVVSAYSSGSYARRVSEALAEIASQVPLQQCILYSVRGEAIGQELCHLSTETYHDQGSCELCRQGSAPIAIDQVRFTTRIGTTTLDLPKSQQIEDQAFTIVDLDGVNAFAVHADRPDRHKHLTVYVDTAALLQSDVFRAQARLGWARCLHNFAPDLVIVPAHDGTDALVEWLRSRGIAAPLALNLEEPPGSEVAAKIVSASQILLCDDAVITGRSIIAALETVQRTKADRQGGPFVVRGFVLLARPATYDIWKGLRSRFFVDNQHRLFAAWELYLPDGGIPGQPSCPWCDEMYLLERALRSGVSEEDGYLKRRMAALRAPAGLRSQLFLGSEVDRGSDLGAAGTRTTPGSYLGAVSDVAAFVGMAAFVQRMRNDWAARPERLSQRYALPLDKMLQRFTDPVIVSSLLRAIASHELSAVSDFSGLEADRVRLGHPQQHPVLAAEALLAVAQRKIPQAAADAALFEALGQLPASMSAALRGLFSGVTRPTSG